MADSQMHTVNFGAHYVGHNIHLYNLICNIDIYNNHTFQTIKTSFILLLKLIVVWI